jgi:regulatory protein
LVRRGYAADQIAAVVARLKSCRYLDDLEFARSWVRSRAQRRAIGPARVRQELHARGVGESEIGAVLEELLAGEDIRNLAEGAVRRKLESLRGLAPDIARRRLAAFLDRRGFDGGTILEMCRRHFPRDEDDQ